jgi:hypothetical protein
MVALSAWLMAAGVTYADHIDLPVKWSQLPDTNVSDDLFSMHQLAFPEDLVVHDDWLCTSPEPVVALRWWGSYLEDEIPGEYAGGPRGSRHLPFEVSWHGNVPPGVDTPYSHPAAPILEDMVNAQEELAFVDGSGKPVYVYNAYLNVPWDQVEGTIYWLDVALDPFDEWSTSQGQPSRWTLPPDGVPTWGWSKAEEEWGGMAIQNQGWHWGPWDDPGDSLHYDRAFEIMIPEPSTLVLLALASLASAARRR